MTVLFIFLFLIANAHSAVPLSNAQNTVFIVYCWQDTINDYVYETRCLDLEDAENTLERYRSHDQDCHIREEE